MCHHSYDRIIFGRRGFIDSAASFFVDYVTKICNHYKQRSAVLGALAVVCQTQKTKGPPADRLATPLRETRVLSLGGNSRSRRDSLTSGLSNRFVLEV